MDRGQVFGGVLGLGSLLSAFLLPFSSIAEAPGGPTDTLLGIFKLFITTISNIEAVGLPQLTNLAYVYFLTFALVGLSGVLGSFPRWGAALGIIGMATSTIAPFFIFPTYNFTSANYGLGYYAIWGTSALMIYAAYMSRKERGGAPAQPTEAEPYTEAESGESTAT